MVRISEIYKQLQHKRFWLIVVVAIASVVITTTVIQSRRKSAHTEPRHKLRMSGLVTSIAWSPDGKLIAAGSENNKVYVWHSNTWDLTSTLDTHTDWVFSVAWSPTGELLASASGDNTIRIWEMSDGDLVNTIPDTHDVNEQLIFLEEDILVNLTSNLNVWDIGNNTLLSSIPIGQSPKDLNGRRIAIAEESGAVEVRDFITSDVIHTIDGASPPIQALEWSPLGDQIAVAYEGGTVSIWNIETTTVTMTLSHPNPVLELSWSPGGRKLATLVDLTTYPNKSQTQVYIWNLETEQDPLILTSHSDVFIRQIVWGPSGKLLAGVTQLDRIDEDIIEYSDLLIWQAEDGKLLDSLRHSSVWIDEPPLWSPDGNLIASAAGTQVYIWESPH